MKCKLFFLTICMFVTSSHLVYAASLTIGDILNINDNIISFRIERISERYGGYENIDISDVSTVNIIYEKIKDVKLYQKKQSEENFYFSFTVGEESIYDLSANKYYEYYADEGFDLLENDEKIALGGFVSYEDIMNILDELDIIEWKIPPHAVSYDKITIKDILSQGGIERKTIDGIYFYKSSIEENDSFSTSISDKDDIGEFYERFIKLPLNDQSDSLNKTYIKITFTEYFDDNDQVIYEPDGFYYWNVGMEERKILYRLYISADDIMKILNDMNYSWHENIGGGDGKIIGVPVKNTIEFKINSSIYIINGVEKQIDETNKNVVPFIDEKADRTLVPLRAIGEASGYAVEWKADEQKVILEQNDKQIELRIGESNITVRNGDDATKVVETDCVPVIVESRTFLPIRIVAELMGYEVDWKEATKEIILQRK